MEQKLKKKWLIYSSVGPAAKVDRWMRPDIGADIAVCRYHDDSPTIEFARYSATNHSVKFPNFFFMLEKFPSIAGYDYFLWADDDIEIASEDVVGFMQRVESHGMDMAQPSLSAESAFSWPHLVHKPDRGLEPTIFVEIQFFAISKRLFEEALPFFRMGHSGFGMDIATSRLILRRGFAAAVDHSIQMHHPPRDRSATVHGIKGISEINSQIQTAIYERLGFWPDLIQLAYVSAKLKTLNRFTLFASAPVYSTRCAILGILRVLGFRK